MRRIADGSFQEVRRSLVAQFIRSEAAELETAWAVTGWTLPVIRRAERCANTLIDVFGQGPYRIVILHPRRNGHAGP
jgi:hypothetical protein